MTKLVHINKIECCQASSLEGMTFAAQSACKLPLNVNFEEFNIIGLVDAKIEDNIENKEKVYTTTVVFQTCNKMPDRRRNLAFRLTSTTGSQFLVGTCARPYTIVKESNPYPGKVSETTLKTVTITWKCKTPMLYIV